MRLTAGDGQFVHVPEDAVGRFLANGWRPAEVAPAAKVVAPNVTASPTRAKAEKAAPRRGRRKATDSGVDATE